MIPSSYWIEDYPSIQSDWPIEGILCPYITILSGQPKVGKSTLSTQLVISLITKEPFLGREVNLKNPKVCWMGFDSGWVGELQKNTENRINGSLLLQNPLSSFNHSDWRELGTNLVQENIGYLVIDHLYGLAGQLNLNDSQEAHRVMSCLLVVLNEFQIPILLIAQATKNIRGSGQMAHSNLFKGTARVLLELAGNSRKGKRTLSVNGNEIAGETLHFILKPTQIEAVDGSVEKVDKQKRDYEENLQRTQKFFNTAQANDLEKAASAGRLFRALGYSKSDDGGRKMVERYINFGLIEATPEGLIPGHNYSD